MRTTLQKEKMDDRLTEAHNDFQKGMNRYTFFKVHNHATSDDLVQTTFLKTWRYMDNSGTIKLMKPFLYHILNNLIIDEYRKHKTSSLDVLIENGFEPGCDQSEKTFNRFDGKIAIDLIKKLPKKYATILTMRYGKSMSPSEISEVIKKPVATISVQAHRGLAKLKKLYHR